MEWEQILENKKSILVVDDEEDIRDILESILVFEGYEVTLAADGIQAFDELSKKSFDLVLTDLRMPRASGIDLLKKMETLPMRIPVLAMTGFADFTLNELTRLGVFAVVAKPFNESKLLEQIRRCLISTTPEPVV